MHRSLASVTLPWVLHAWGTPRRAHAAVMRTVVFLDCLFGMRRPMGPYVQIPRNFAAACAAPAAALHLLCTAKHPQLHA